MKLAYAIENIRRIRDLPEIEILPLTILVGRNSAGKSTFLRSLPLIRQSIETRSSAPILWFGDLVDFGDPNVAIGEGGEGKQAAFRFTIRNLTGRPRPFYFAHRYYRRSAAIEVSQVSIRYVIAARKDRTVLQTIEIRIPDEDTEVLINFAAKEGAASSRIKINGKFANFLPRSYELQSTNTNLFSSPRLLFRSTEKEETPFLLARPRGTFEEALCDAFSRRAKRKLSSTTFRREARKILASNRFRLSDIDTLMQTSPTATFKQMYADLLSKDNDDFKNEIFAIHGLARTFNILDIIEDELTSYFRRVEYLEPVRAASERFYRKQELEISSIAPNGSNFPMFLASLSQQQLGEFSEWVRAIFGYGVNVKRTVGHISIHLTSAHRSINVADTGYGVSQILPVLGVLWSTQGTTRNYRNIPGRSNIRTLAIEQPELHLHPAHQAKLADAFVAAVTKERQSEQSPEIRLIVETHSEALINRLGELIESGAISSNSVQIVIFSAPDDLVSPTNISISSFDEDGALKDWPFGFFNYSE